MPLQIARFRSLRGRVPSQRVCVHTPQLFSTLGVLLGLGSYKYCPKHRAASIFLNSCFCFLGFLKKLKLELCDPIIPRQGIFLSFLAFEGRSRGVTSKNSACREIPKIIFSPSFSAFCSVVRLELMGQRRV